MKFVFRSDSSSMIGSGHIMRCLALAEGIRSQGGETLFVCREHHGNLCNHIETRGFAVSLLPFFSDEILDENSTNYEAWLGTTWHKDAEQTFAAINAIGSKPDWLIVDHYGIDHRWESRLRKFVGRILVIDDLADRVHDCDLLLDQNLVSEMNTRYANKVPITTGLLLGPKFAMMQSIYAELHDQISPREGTIQRILIYFGGADNDNLTGRALSAFISLKRLEIQVDVVISSSNPHLDRIRQMSSEYDNIHLHTSLPTLAPLMAKADLAIGAGGSTTWERLCMGLPTLVVTLAENQLSISEELNKRSLIRYLGHKNEISVSDIAQELDELIHQGLAEDWSKHCSELVDGRGVNRVCAVLTVTRNTSIRARAIRLEDEDILLEWANDPLTRQNAFSPELIEPETHRDWFLKRLNNLEFCRIYIVETIDGFPIGQVRFELHDQAWEIHYALSPLFRGRGLGRSLLEAALKKLRIDIKSGMLFGQVKDHNYPSQKIFESLGFESNCSTTRGVVVYQREL